MLLRAWEQASLTSSRGRRPGGEGEAIVGSRVPGLGHGGGGGRENPCFGGFLSLRRSYTFSGF